jgi:transcription factor C subunit 6
MCWSMDWANSEVIAVGCTNGTFSGSKVHSVSIQYYYVGSVAIFRVREALEHPTDQRDSDLYECVFAS